MKPKIDPYTKEFARALEQRVRETLKAEGKRAAKAVYEEWRHVLRDKERDRLDRIFTPPEPTRGEAQALQTLGERALKTEDPRAMKEAAEILIRALRNKERIKIRETVRQTIALLVKCKQHSRAMAVLQEWAPHFSKEELQHLAKGIKSVYSRTR